MNKMCISVSNVRCDVESCERVVWKMWKMRWWKVDSEAVLTAARKGNMLLVTKKP